MRYDRTALYLTRLTQEGEQTLLSLTRLREALKSEVDATEDEGDPNLEERQRMITLIHVLERKLQAIDDALQQLKRGRYGFCECCGEPIDPARLEVMPEATFCLRCKAIAERRPHLRATPAQSKFHT